MRKINLITDEVLKNVQDLRDKCGELHLMAPPVTFIKMELEGPDGEKLLEIDFKSNSWVRNAYNIATMGWLGMKTDTSWGSTFGPGTPHMKQTGGTVKTSVNNYYCFIGQRIYDVAQVGAGDSSKGIVIGAGTKAEAFDDYSLSTLISHGTTANTMSYNAQALPAVSYDAASQKWTSVLTRVFNNNSGNSIIVTETGIYQNTYSGDWGAQVFMTCRDLLSSPVEVPNGGQLTVTYTVEAVYPA